METIQNYKCPCCNAPLTFMGEKLNCEYCGTEVTLEAMKQASDAFESGVQQQAFDWDVYQPREYGFEESESLSSYTCPSCGAEITGDSTMGSTVCPYCGNATIVKKQFDGALKPDFVIPFKIDKKKAMSEFENAYKRAPFLPDEFKNKKRIEEMTGVYVPFWMFDCECKANITYKARTVTHWSDSEYDYIKEDHYRLVRAGSLSFQNIPVDGSKKADDTYMEAIEPFNYSEAVEFNTAYLSGYLADKYDVSADESIQRANERVKNSTEAAFARTVSGKYSSVMPENSIVNFSGGKIRYSLLPVWMLNIKYEGNNYKFAINGQTGKTVGEFPISKKKRNAYFAKVCAIAVAAATAIATVFVYYG